MRKAQSAAGAAGLVALLAVFIVLYMLLLPPQERADLLGEQSTTGTGTGAKTGLPTGAFTINKTALTASPGRIEYLKFSSYDHPLPAVNLYTTTSAKILAKEESLYVKNGIFDFLSRNITFNVKDLEYTDNVLLSANTEKAQGRLRIYLNNVVIYDGNANPLPVINIDKELLQAINTILFEVSPVGWKFWTTNEFTLTKFQVTADVMDVSEQTSKTSFIVTDTEKFNLEKATLRFFPDCNPSDVGKLRIYFNNENIYSSIPDCSQLNQLDLSPDLMSSGTNDITFKTDKGYYTISQINVHTELKKQTYPAYYFELDERLFVGEEEDTNACGEVDGVCPANCDEDLDRDCCFETGNKYWCDVVPNEEGDRCIAVVSKDVCGRCLTGYEDSTNNAPDACKGLCGDDKDNKCPVGCSKSYDKDCCFADSTDNYWCDNVPIYGIDQVCKHSLTQSQCKDCAGKYKTKTGESYSCEDEEETDIKTLRDDFDVFVVFRFLDDKEKKSANIYVNGHKFYLDTYKGEYKKVISNYIEPGSNAVKIEPDVSTLDIIELKIEVQPKK